MRPVVLMIVVALSLTAMGCGGDDETTTTTTAAEGTGGVEVSETEYAMTPSDAELESLLPGETITSIVEAGQVKFEITNDGEETHSFVFNDVGKEIELGKDLAPGESAEMSVDVDPGFYEYYCPIDDHQGLGMQGQLEVN